MKGHADRPPLCQRCEAPMEYRGSVWARGREPPVDVESACFVCPRCGTERARVLGHHFRGAGRGEGGTA